MNQFNKDVQNALLNNSTSLKEIFRQQLEKTVNQLLKSELSAVLGYEAYERNHQTRNARNGSYDASLIPNLAQLVSGSHAIAKINFRMLFFSLTLDVLIR